MRAIENESLDSAQASLEQKKKRKRRKLLLLLLLLLLFLGLTFTSVVRFFWSSSDQTASTDPRTPAQVEVIETGEEAETKNAIASLQSMVRSLQNSVQELENDTSTPTLPNPGEDVPPQNIDFDAYQDLKNKNHLDQLSNASILTRGTITNEFFLKNGKLIDISDVNEEGLSDGEILKWNEDDNEWVAAEDEDDDTTYEAGSGLTLDDDVFSLGGSLDENTTLDLEGFAFTFTDGDVSVDDSLYATALYQNGNEVCDMSGNCGGGGGVVTWNLAGDGGTTQTINNTDTVTIAGGSGLTSVASATDTLTLNIGAGSGITVNANDVAVNQAFNFAWTGTQSWSNTADFNGNISFADTDIALDGASSNLSVTGNFSVNGDDFFVQKSDGNVGIGNTAPGYALDVTGGIATSNDLYISGIGLNDTASNTTSGASLIGVFDEFTNSSSTTVQAVLADLDAAIAGASHAPVTLAGAYDYLTLTGQQITLNQIDLATDVTGTLPLAYGGTNADLSGVSNGGIIYKSGTELAGSGSLTGVLKGNGSGAPTAMTGAQNYVTRWTDASSLGTGILYDDATNVGISTTTPGAKLDVVGGSIRADGDVIAGDLYLGYDDTSATITTSNTNQALTIDPDGSGSIFLHGATYYIDASGLIYASGLATTGYTATAGELRADVFRDGDSAYYLQPADTAISAVFAGNVGIGTTSPDFALQVNGVIAPETTDQDLGTSSLRWDIFANTINADSTVTLSGLSAGTDNTVLVLNGSNQVVTDEIDPRVWGTTLLDGSGTAGYVSYWSDADTLTAEQYLNTIRGGLGNDITAAGAGEILYSTGTNAYESLPAGTAGYVLVSNGAAAPTWIDSGALGASYWAKVAGVLSPALAEPLAATSAATTVATFTADGSNTALQVGGVSSYAQFDNAGNLVFTNGSGASIDSSAGLTIGGTTQTGLTLGRTGISTNIANLTTDGVVYTSGGNGILNSEAQLAITRGGTNSTATPTAGALAYGTGTAYAFSSAGTIGQALMSGGTGTPTWGTLGLTYGGTNADLSSVATGGLIYKAASSLAGTGALTGVLKGNGSGAPTAMTGTTNYVTRWTDANTLGIGILYDDGTNVGIGTTSPDFALQVNGVIAPETANQDIGTTALRWDIFANEINADSTLTFTGLNVGVDNTVLVLNGSNQVETREIDPQVWSSDLITGAGTNGYVTYWTGTDTIGAEQYLSTIRGGLGGDVTAAGAGEILYSTGSTTYDSLAAGTLGYVLSSGGAGAPTWVDPATLGTNYWQIVNGAFSPRTPYTNNADLLLGSDATESAKFAVLNMFPGSGTPTASVSSGLSGTSMFLTADGTLATQNRMDLTIGNSSTYDTTGNILINPNGTGNVGIGQSNTGEVLSVNTIQGQSGLGLYHDAATSARRGVITYAGINDGVNGNGGLQIISQGTDESSNGAGNIHFFTPFEDSVDSNTWAGVEARMTILQAGNVGIGTTNPVARLDIDTGSNSSGLRLRGLDESVEIADIFVNNLGSLVFDTTAGSDTGGLLDVRTADNEYGLVLRESDGTGLTTFANFYVTDAASDYLSINLNGTTNGNALNIAASNNIGIGTTTPTNFKLEIAGSVGPSTNDTYNLGSDSLRWADLFLGGETIHLGSSTTDEGTISYDTTGNIFNFGTDSTTNGDIAFFTNDLYLDKSAGNVGINTTTPAQALHVVGNVRVSGLTPSLPVKTNANNDLISGAINLASAEVTGILPLTNGGTNADLSGASTGSLIYKGASALQASGSLTGILKGNGSGAPTAITGTQNYVTRWTDANTLGTGVLYDNGTNVGISTTTPTSFKLEVAGSVGPSANNAYDLGSDTRRWANVYATNFYQNGNAVCDVTGNCASVGNLWQVLNGAISPSTPYTNNSDLLIGSTATESAKFAVLNVFPGSGTPTASVSTGLSGNSIYLAADGTLGTQNRRSLTIGNSSAHNTTGNVLINSNGTGNVGIGTTSPDFALQVNGIIAPETTDQDLGSSSLRWDMFANTINADSTVTLTGVSAGTDNTVLVLNASNQVIQDEINAKVWDTAATLVDGTGTANYVARWTDTDSIGIGVLYDNGTNVGIGTTNPTAGLVVANARLQVTGSSSPTTGTGVELGHDGTDGILLSYDRSGALYKNMRYNALGHEFEISGSDTMTLSSGGLIVDAQAIAVGDAGSGNAVSGLQFLNNGTAHAGFRFDGTNTLYFENASSSTDPDTWYLGTNQMHLSVRNGNISTNRQLISTVATGTAPLDVASTTVVGSLNSDMTDGYHAAAHNDFTGSRIVTRHGSGYIFSNYFNMTANNVGSGVTAIPVETGSDNYLRWGNAAAVIGFLNGGSGLDADTLDGISSGSFLRSDTDNSVTSTGVEVSFPSTAAIPNATGDQASLEVIGNNGAGTDAFMQFHVPGDYALYFGLDGGINDLVVGGWSMGANSYRVWHAGNDGAGSGLAADTTDGYHADESNTVSTLAARNGSGDIQARLFRPDYTSTNSNINYFMTQVAVGTTASGADNYIRPSTTAQVRSELDVWVNTTGDTMTGTLTMNATLAANGAVTVDGHTLLNGTDTWLRTNGATGWYSATYGGGWYMTDSTWIRNYNGTKQLWFDAGAAEVARFSGTTTPYITVGEASSANNGAYIQWNDTSNKMYVSPHGIQAIVIDSGGNVGIGKDTEPYRLDVNGTVRATGVGTGTGLFGVSSGGYAVYGTTGGGGYGVYGIAAGGTGVSGTGTGGGGNAGVYGTHSATGGYGVHGFTSSGYGVYAESNGTGRALVANNTVGNPTFRCFTSHAQGCGGDQAWWNFSDRRLKDDIKPIDNALEKVLNLEGVTYYMKKDASKTRTMGFIAQDALPYVPELVSYEETDGYYGMQTAQMTALLVEAMKEQNSQVQLLASSVGTNLTFSSDGELALSGSNGSYSVTPVGSSPLTNVVGASKAVIGKITAGLINTKELVVTKSATIADLSVTNLSISGTSIQDYIRSIVQLELQNSPNSLPEDAIAQDFNSGMVIHNYNTTVTIVQSPTASSSTTFSATSSGALAINPEINVTEVTQVIPDPRFDVLATLVSWSDAAVDGVRTLFFNTPTVFRYLAWFQGPVKVNADTSGTILIPADTLKARVSFSKPFPENPSVYVNFTDGVSIAHTITDVNASGFTINFANAPATDLTIQWLALLREDSETGPSLEIMETDDNSEPATVPASTPTPPPEPTPEESEPPSPEPTQEPTPTPATSSTQPATPSATGFSDLLDEEDEEATEPAETASPSATP